MFDENYELKILQQSADRWEFHTKLEVWDSYKFGDFMKKIFFYSRLAEINLLWT